LLTNFIPEGSIKVPLDASFQKDVTKETVIEELVDLLPEAKEANLRSEILRAVLHRENQMSTGIGDGIAIPHGSASIDSDLVISAGLAEGPGIEYETIDKKPAHIFFLLVARNGVRTQHLQALAHIARLMKNRDIHNRLLRTTDATTFRQILKEAE